MKYRTAAVLAAVLIPLLALGAGVFVAAGRSSASKAPPTPSGSSRVAEWLEQGRSNAPAAKPLEPVAAIPVDRARLRYEIVTCLERLRYVGGRSGECKRLWPEASTEEEGRALQREKVALDNEWGLLSNRLCELAAKDPGLIVELVRTAHEVPQRLGLMGLVAPDVNAEITSEDAASGPLLSGLLAMASGSTDEKAHFASFAGHLTRANRDLGQALVTLMADPDFHVRKHAGQALWALAHGGALKEFLKEQIPALKQAALSQEGGLNYLCVGNPLKILASIGAEESDDFVLHRFEVIESRNDYETVTAALISAPRLAARHEARLVMAILRGLEMPAPSGLYYGLLEIAQHLPPEQRANIARVAEQHAPPPSQISVPRLYTVSAQDRPVYRSMTGVSRWELNADPGSPRVRRN